MRTKLVRITVMTALLWSIGCGPPPLDADGSASAGDGSPAQDGDAPDAGIQDTTGAGDTVEPSDVAMSSDGTTGDSAEPIDVPGVGDASQPGDSNEPGDATPGEPALLQFGGTSNEALRALASGPAGLIAVGRTDSHGAGLSDTLVTAFSHDGALTWALALGGPGEDDAMDVRVMPDGGAVLTGRTESFGGHSDAWVARITAAGDLLWARSYGGNGWDLGQSVTPLAGGGFAVVAETYNFGPGAPDTHNLWVFGIDDLGEIQWSHVYGDDRDGDAGFRIIEATDLGGQPDGLMVVGGTESWGLGKDDIWLLRLDAQGGVLWSRAYGEDADDEARGVVQTADGGFAVTGFTRGYDSQNSNVLLLKVSAQGELEWMRTYGGAAAERGQSVALHEGGFLVAGVTASWGKGGADAYLLATDDAGQPLWLRTLGGSGNDEAAAVLTTETGVWLAGRLVTDAGDEDALLARLDDWPCKSTLVPLSSVAMASPIPTVTTFDPTDSPGGTSQATTPQVVAIDYGIKDACE